MNVTTEPSARKRSDRPNLILGICCMSLLLVSMDVTIVNVALPAIQHELHATLSGLQWILDAYTLVVASLLMLAGSVAERRYAHRSSAIGLHVIRNWTRYGQPRDRQ
jgi:MFS family permease